MRRDFLIYKKKKRKPCETWGGEENKKVGVQKKAEKKGTRVDTPGSGPFTWEGGTS
jgi:hypothetical protein